MFRKRMILLAFLSFLLGACSVAPPPTVSIPLQPTPTQAPTEDVRALVATMMAEARPNLNEEVKSALAEQLPQAVNTAIAQTQTARPLPSLSQGTPQAVNLDSGLKTLTVLSVENKSTNETQIMFRFPGPIEGSFRGEANGKRYTCKIHAVEKDILYCIGPHLKAGWALFEVFFGDETVPIISLQIQGPDEEEPTLKTKSEEPKYNLGSAPEEPDSGGDDDDYPGPGGDDGGGDDGGGEPAYP